MNFVLDLTTLYYIASTKRLRPDFLKQLTDVFAAVYCNVGQRLSAKDYELLLRACVNSLVGFTDKVHDICLETPPVKTLFSITHQLTDFIIQKDTERVLFIPEQWDAYKALAAPLENLPIKFNLPMSVEYFVPVENPGNFSDVHGGSYSFAEKSEQRAWDRKVDAWQKARNKASEEAYAQLEPIQSAMLGTPLFIYAQGLIPSGTVQLPFDIPEERWFEGTWIVAAQGRGKTNLLRHLILHHLPDASIIILDAKGDLLRSFQRLGSIADRLVIIEPDLDFPPAINPLDMGRNAVEFLSYLFELLDTKMTPNQTTLFRLVLTLLEKVSNATLETFRDIIQNGWKPYEQYVQQLKPRDRDFFEKEFNTKTYSERKPEVLLRLRLLLSNPFLEAMLLSPKTKLNMGQLMDKGSVICINNSYDPDKLGEDGAEFFGRMIIAMVWAAARRRASFPDHKKRPVFFFIDEAHYVIARDTTISKIIQQCRFQKIAMIFSHQEVQQIKNEDVKSALTNFAIKFANSSDEAHELAPRLQTTPEFIKQQKRGSFACYVVDKTDTAVSISVPPVPVRPDHVLLNHPYIHDKEYELIISLMHAQFCFTASEDNVHEPQPDPQPQQPNDDTLYWKISISPKKAKSGTSHVIQILADPTGKTKKFIAVKIPPNTKDGARFRLRGAGVFRREGSRGDVVITVRVPDFTKNSQVTLYGDADPDEIG